MESQIISKTGNLVVLTSDSQLDPVFHSTSNLELIIGGLAQ